jgi:proteic killer suppression protein
MIRSFRSSETQRLFADQPSKKFRAIQRIARRKLEMIHAAEKLDDLRNPPGNRLEVLKGDRAGQFSIRINDQFRICFRWIEGAAEDVEIVDYH